MLQQLSQGPLRSIFCLIYFILPFFLLLVFVLFSCECTLDNIVDDIKLQETMEFSATLIILQILHSSLILEIPAQVSVTYSLSLLSIQ